jgi:SnoaL-like protein
MSGGVTRIAMLTGLGAVLCTGCSARDEAGEQPDLAQEIAALEGAVADAKQTLQRLKDYDELENLAGAYGHYVDKSRHDDVADLFARDGVVEIYGRGVFLGQDRVRQYMHNLSPTIGPREGSLFNHMHLQPVIHVAADGKTANVRSRPFIMFGIYGVNAQWGSGIYENRFVKEDGVWKIDYLHGYWTFYTNYEDGWARKASPMFGQYERLPPDRPLSVPYEGYPTPFVPPFHYVNPVSGRSDHYGDSRLREP